MTEKTKILIVDDKAENLFALQQILGSLKIEIIEASNGNEALTALLYHSFALVILDVHMPGMNGFEVAEFMRGQQETKKIPIIFLSAIFASEHHQLKGYESGAIDFITKPFPPKVLINKVKIFVEFYEQKQILQKEIEERKKSEIALRESEERYRSLVEATTSIIWSADSSGGFVVPQPSWEKYTGQPWEEYKDFGWTKKIHSDDIERLLQGWEKACQEISVYESHGRLWNSRLEDWRDFQVKAVPIMETDGSLREWVGIIEDITEQKQLEAQLLQSQKMDALGTLAGGIAHEFNNILAAMQGYGELLLVELPEGSIEKDYAANIYQAGKRAQDLVLQILTFSRMDLGQRSVYDIPPLIKEAIKMMKATIPSSIQIEQDIDSHCSPILANPTQINQVLLNLCTNAFHAMGKEGGVLRITLKEKKYEAEEVFLSALKAGSYLNLTVSDTGCGMSAKVQEKIFDPFFTTKEVGEGTGLGMSVVHSIVEQHEGLITVDSQLASDQYPGRTTIQIYFPVVKAEKQEGKQEESILAKERNHILVLDESPMLTKFYQKALKRMGYEVTTFNECADALEEFQRNTDKYDLVFMEYSMKLLDGNNLVPYLLKTRPNVPIILAVEHTDAIMEIKRNTKGVRAYAIKPLEIKDLLPLIQKILK
ncbi:MAG: response regulator [SAR324 cluster bacterium]|nr:response regulator [SAR324 cluster bacterium]